MGPVMTLKRFVALLRATVTDPRQAGAEVIAMNWPLQGLWLALMLAAVLLSLLTSGLLQLAPLPDDQLGDVLRLSPAYRAPLLFALINWGQSVVSVLLLHGIGRLFGSRGALADVLAVMIWLQVVSLVLAVSLFVVGLALPTIGGVMFLAAFFWGIWATIGLVDAAGRFDNMLKAAAVCAVALVAGFVIMTVLSALIGGFAAQGG